MNDIYTERNLIQASWIQFLAEHPTRGGLAERLIFESGFKAAKSGATELLEALKDIAEPMVKIQADAKAQDAKVDGVFANMLCADANWLRDKARAALHKAQGE